MTELKLKYVPLLFSAIHLKMYFYTLYIAFNNRHLDIDLVQESVVYM